jgi:hypothetical protein
LITVDLENSNADKTTKSLSSKWYSWLALLGSEHLTDTDPGNIFNHTCAPTHSHMDHTHWLWSININYFGVSEFLDFHLRKVPFSQTHTYEYLQTLVLRWISWNLHCPWFNGPCRQEKKLC